MNLTKVFQYSPSNNITPTDRERSTEIIYCNVLWREPTNISVSVTSLDGSLIKIRFKHYGVIQHTLYNTYSTCTVVDLLPFCILSQALKFLHNIANTHLIK